MADNDSDDHNLDWRGRPIRREPGSQEPRPNPDDPDEIDQGGDRPTRSGRVRDIEDHDDRGRRFRDRQYDDDDDDFYDDEDEYPIYERPHRGTTVLILGILAIVLCQPIGIVAWWMGTSDLKAMQRGEMDPKGRSETRTGQILGIVAFILLVLQLLAIGFLVVLSLAFGA